MSEFPNFKIVNDIYLGLCVLLQIKIPMFYMNSEDDPVVPVPLLKHPKEQAGKCPL